MSAAYRKLAHARALNMGKLAKRAGKKLRDCPYKVSEWGLGQSWIDGWVAESKKVAKIEAKKKGKKQPKRDWGW